MADISTYIERRNALLKNKEIPDNIIEQGWFILSHMLLSEKAQVAHFGCDDGSLTYTMAVLYPQVHMIGIDQDKRKINKAKVEYQLPNLEFRQADVTTAFAKDNAFDAIINSFVLHEIYSASRYNDDNVSAALNNHFKMLKNNGLMYIEDYAKPPPEEFVSLEMPDKQSGDKSLDKLSEADLLVWYSEHARPRNDSGTGGFFLDELPERVPGTRLFRLPYRWAYEFIMRKDDRKHWEEELPIEYTFFTQAEFRNEIQKAGARASYTAPHWNEDYIEENFRDHFRLLNDKGEPMGYPPTSFIVVARKMAERKSLLIHERRPTQTEDSKLTITAMRNNTTGELVDIVSRDEQVSEIIPYRIDPETGRLKVYLHDGVPRSIANSVPRNGFSIDDRRWSGHMVEPVSVPHAHMPDKDVEDEALLKHTESFAKKFLGLSPKDNQALKLGPDYFPAPDYIDEVINTYYLEVNKAEGEMPPKTSLIGTDSFQEKGYIREVDAQQVLDAITVGKIPNARLELQLLYLFNHLGVQIENWAQKQIAWKIGDVQSRTKLRTFLKNYHIEDKRFKDVKGTAGQLRSVHSIFVEEGQSRGAVTGLASRDLDFVVQNDQTINRAVVLPLSKNMKKEIHAGVMLKQMPVPQRHSGDANIISAPYFDLPANVTNIKLAKEYLAEQFGVTPEMVIKLGESYFSHIGMTQQKIHPFGVVVPEGTPDDPNIIFIPFYQMMLLRKSIKKDTHMMLTLARAYRFFHEEIAFDFKRRVGPIMQERFEHVKPEWSLPMNFEPSPTRKASGETSTAPSVEAKTIENTKKTPKPEIQKEPKLEKSGTIDLSETTRKDEKKAQKTTKKVANPFKKETNIKLSNEFEHDFEEFVEILEKDLPKLDFEK
ncbi:MAG: class I SAM-dependent methyltransferase [Pseudomonadota bacterium]